MTVAENWQWIGIVVAGVAFVAVVGIAWLAVLRWLVFIVPAIILVSFAFEPEMQLRFTAVLIGLLAILYVPLLAAAWVWRQVTGLRPVSFARAGPPSALELVHQTFADEEASDRAERQGKAAWEACDQDDRDSRARHLEKQGAFSLWSRR